MTTLHTSSFCFNAGAKSLTMWDFPDCCQIKTDSNDLVDIDDCMANHTVPPFLNQFKSLVTLDVRVFPDGEWDPLSQMRDAPPPTDLVAAHIPYLCASTFISRLHELHTGLVSFKRDKVAYIPDTVRVFVLDVQTFADETGIILSAQRGCDPFIDTDLVKLFVEYREDHGRHITFDVAVAEMTEMMNSVFADRPNVTTFCIGNMVEIGSV